MIDVKFPDYVAELTNEFTPVMDDFLDDRMTIQLKSLLSRTQKGIDVGGNSFTPYADATLKIKQRKGQQQSPVNLRDSTEMLTGLHTVLGIPKGKEDAIQKIIFNTTFDNVKANWQNFGTKHIPQREFFGFTDKEIDVINDDFEKTIDGKVRSLNAE